MFHNNSFLRARNQLSIVVDLSKKPKGTERAEGEEVKSFIDTVEKNVEEEKEEEVEEEEEAGEDKKLSKLESLNE